MGYLYPIPARLVSSSVSDQESFRTLEPHATGPAIADCPVTVISCLSKPLWNFFEGEIRTTCPMAFVSYTRESLGPDYFETVAHMVYSVDI